MPQAELSNSPQHLMYGMQPFMSCSGRMLQGLLDLNMSASALYQSSILLYINLKARQDLPLLMLTAEYDAVCTRACGRNPFT